MPDGKRMRKATKIISIHSSPVFALSTTDDFLVSGAGDGFIRFFDNRLRLAAWFEVNVIGLLESTTMPFFFIPQHELGARVPLAQLLAIHARCCSSNTEEAVESSGVLLGAAQTQCKACLVLPKTYAEQGHQAARIDVLPLA